MDVRLLTGPETGPEGDLLNHPRARGIPVTKIPSLVREVDPVRDILATAALWRELRRLRPGIVHTHSGKAGILGRLAARKTDAPPAKPADAKH